MFNYLSPLTYWILIIIWSTILLFCIKRLVHRKIESAFFTTVLVILTIDAIRTLFESLYFGVWYTSVAGILPKSTFEFLIRPELVIIPKLVNLVAAVWIALLFMKKWLPQEEDEQFRTSQHLKELEDRTQEQAVIEESLRKSEERFRNIIEASPMGIHLYELTPGGELILTGANPAANDILGIDHNLLLGKRIEEAFPSLEFSDIPNRYKEICANGKPWQTEDLHYKDGAISGAFQVYAFQTLPGHMAAKFIDITERKQTEEALSMTQFTMDNAAVSIFWIKPNGSFTYINTAACDLLGYNRSELMNMEVMDLTPDISIRETVLERIKADKHMTFEIDIQKKDGTVIPVEVTSHYIRFGENEFEFAFVIDLTKHKEVEAALAAMNKNLEELVAERTSKLEEMNIQLTEVDRLKSALLSTVTHELKTPLTSIIGYTKLTNRDFVRDFLPLASGNRSLTRRGDRVSENLSVIGQEATRLLALIDNFLALSRIKAGNDTGQKQLLNMEETIGHVARLSQSYFASQPDISLTMNIEKDLPSILANPDTMPQAILNLLDNAAKFADQGEVSLNARVSDNGNLRISVSDNGPGIPECERVRIFEAFHQICADNDCNIKPSGTGMGLPITKQIVENHGGTIWLECPDSGGCTFIVELPIEESQRNG